MVHERVEHVFRRDHVTADQQFGFAHRWSALVIPGHRRLLRDGRRVHRLRSNRENKNKQTNKTVADIEQCARKTLYTCIRGKRDGRIVYGPRGDCYKGAVEEKKKKEKKNERRERTKAR